MERSEATWNTTDVPPDPDRLTVASEMKRLDSYLTSAEEQLTQLFADADSILEKDDGAKLATVRRSTRSARADTLANMADRAELIHDRLMEFRRRLDI
jgi:hypothetical protein